MSAAKKLSADHRKKIGESLREYHRRRLEDERQIGHPKLKRCSQCGAWKRVPRDFPMRRRATKCGVVRYYPKGECKLCAAERSKAWRDKQKGDDLKIKREKARRRYQRKYASSRRIPSAPLGNFLEELVHRHGRSAVVLASGESPDRIDQIRRGAFQGLELHVADRILVGLNCPEQLVILYPEMED